MATTLMLIALVYKTLDPNAKPSIDDTLVNDIADPDLNLSDFDKVVATDTPEEMISYLIKMKNWPRAAPLPARFEFQRKRIEIADQLLRHELDEEYRAIAVESKIEAASQLYGMDFISKVTIPNLGGVDFADLLQKTIGDYPNDENSFISRAALLAQAKLSFYQFSKTRDKANLEVAEKTIVRLVNEHSDDESILVARDLITRLLTRDNEDEGHEMIASILKQFGKSEAEPLRQLAVDLNDRSLLKKFDFNETMQARRTLGDRGKTELTESTIQLLENPEVGRFFFDVVSQAITWLEETGSYQNTKAIYEKMVAVADGLTDPKMRELANRKGANGLKRLQATQSPIKFADQTKNSNWVSNEQFLGKITVVLFWSPNDSSMKTIQLLGSELKRRYTGGLEVICVRTVDASAPQIEEQLKSMGVKVLGGSESELLREFPVETTPYIAIFDHEGFAKKLSVDIRNLETHIGFLRSEMTKRD